MGNNPATPSPTESCKEPVVRVPGQEPYNKGVIALQKRDYVTAQVALLEAVQSGYTVAALHLGRVYRDGLGVERDLDKAMKYFRMLSEDGDAEGEHQLGLIHFHGLGMSDTFSSTSSPQTLSLPQHALTCITFNFFLRSSSPRGGLVAAEVKITAIFDTDGKIGTDVDYGAAYAHFKKGWDMGNKNCQAHVSWMTTIGQGVPSANVIEGMKLLKEVEEESAEAMAYLGFCAMEGISQRSNYQLAFEYFMKAAQKEHVEGSLFLAYMYLQGKGTSQSTWEAAKHFTAAAERGHPLAQVHLGMMYRDGVGVKKSAADAKAWFEKASRQEFPLGKYCLAELQLHYDNTDWLDIVDLFIAAAEKGNTRGRIMESIYIDTLARVFDGYMKD